MKRDGEEWCLATADKWDTERDRSAIAHLLETTDEPAEFPAEIEPALEPQPRLEYEPAYFTEHGRMVPYEQIHLAEPEDEATAIRRKWLDDTKGKIQQAVYKVDIVVGAPQFFWDYGRAGGIPTSDFSEVVDYSARGGRERQPRLLPKLPVCAEAPPF